MLFLQRKINEEKGIILYILVLSYVVKIFSKLIMKKFFTGFYTGCRRIGACVQRLINILFVTQRQKKKFETLMKYYSIVLAFRVKLFWLRLLINQFTIHLL